MSSNANPPNTWAQFYAELHQSAQRLRLMMQEADAAAICQDKTATPAHTPNQPKSTQRGNDKTSLSFPQISEVQK